jgi:hypothetical protein
MAIAGVQLFRGNLLNRCYNLKEGWFTASNYCSTHAQCANLGNEPDEYHCGASLKNPNMDITSFDNFKDSAIMVWQVITLEGWTLVMYKIEQTSNSFTNVYFIIIVLIGAFFLVNLTLAVITIFFIESQNKFRKQIQQAKAKSEEELLRSFKISNFRQLGFKRILITKDIGFL